MKQINIYGKLLTGFCTFLLFLACSEKEEAADSVQFAQGEYPLTLSAQVGEMSRSTSMDGTWEIGDSIAVQVTSSVDGTSAVYSYAYDGNAWSSKAPYYWQSATERLTIDAWFPYSATKPEVTVASDQSTEADLQASDILQMSSTVSVSFGSSATLALEHQTAKIVVALTAGDGFTADELTDATVSYVNLSGVSGADDGKGSVTSYKSTETGTTTYYALLAPQTIAADTEFIKITQNGIEYTYIPASDITLAEGSQYTYSITVNKLGLSVTCTITDWAGTIDADTGIVLHTVDLSTLSSLTEDVSTGYYDYACSSGKLTIKKNIAIVQSDAATAFSGYIVVEDTASEITLSGVNISTSTSNGIKANGDLTIVLDGENTVYGSSGAPITNASGTTLTLDGDDSAVLNVTAGGGSSAAIGASQNNPCGNLVIAGGTVTANGGTNGAGIGSAFGGECGNITITGGTVTAKGGAHGAGIGSSYAYYGTCTCGDITITGGVVKATGGENGAGIGAGYSYGSRGNSKCGVVTICSTITQVTATTGRYAQNDIGGGGTGGGSTSACEAIYLGGADTTESQNVTEWTTDKLIVTNLTVTDWTVTNNGDGTYTYSKE